MREKLSDNLQHGMDLGREKGASHWLAVLPLSEGGFTFSEGFSTGAVMRKVRFSGFSHTGTREPNLSHGFTLHKGAFRAAVSLR